MSYEVLARKWRPKTFDRMVGQEHVRQALSNALSQGRVHHAFLFSGTRGVGKTTIARILAKCLNCEASDQPTPTPCGECSTCREIDAGRYVDLLEVDAASRTKVDDTRELLDNVQYAPTRGHFKVYLIDEVHMLSKHSFNALLKTLEEPPPHVKFLLATTDPQRLPATVLSRCLQFSLKRLPLSLIQGRMSEICEDESIDTEPAALTLLARAAEGSMRDGLSLLDQAVAFCGGTVSEQAVRAMLGTIDRHAVERVLDALLDADAARVMELVKDLDQQAPDYEAMLGELAGLLQRVALEQAVPGSVDDLHGDRDAVVEFAGRGQPEDLQLYYQIALMGRRDLPLTLDQRGGFEMILLRMLAFRPDDGAAAPPAPPTKKASAASGGGTPRPKPESKPAAAAVSSGSKPPDPDDPWDCIVTQLPHGAARQLAAHCELLREDGRTLHLRLPEADRHLLTDTVRQRLGEAINACYGKKRSLRFHIGEVANETPAERDQRASQEKLRKAQQDIESDPEVKALQSAFGATIDKDSIEPLN